MRAEVVAAVILGVASLGAGRVEGQVLKGSKFALAQPMEFNYPLNTSFGRVLPAGRYFLEVREAPDGTMNLLFLNERHALVGLTQARFLGGGTSGGGAQTSANFLKYEKTGSKVADKTSPSSVGSSAADKWHPTGDLKMAGSGATKPADKTSPPLVGSAAADKWKFDGQPSSQVEHKGWSPQWGGKAGASAATGLPPGESFAHLGFGVNSRARFENNQIIIVGGNEGNAEIIAVVTPAGR